MDGITVLSLFDGMSCGRLALQRAGIKVKQYYAAEIDKYAIQVTQNNFPDTIQLGDVTKIFAKDLPKIDLIIGGSPCQGFSFAGKGLNFEDPRSKLFFEFVRIKKECNPKWFFLENVRMKYEHELVISKYMSVEPIEINSALLSAQNRQRLYWTNINEKPYGLFGELKPDIPQPKDKGMLLKHILETDVSDKYRLSEKAVAKILRRNWIRPPPALMDQMSSKTHAILEKSPCLHGFEHGTNGQFNKQLANGGMVRRLTEIECERLQTVPDNYTNHVSSTQRYKMLGNGWTVDVIAYIFGFMKQELSNVLGGNACT
jgi:site-specific DNA-cytosine methylase